jgi:dUTP pyrophosphatase
MKQVSVRIRIESGARKPEYQSAGAAGMDVVAAEKKLLPAGRFAAVGTGIFLEIPRGMEVQVRPRSGLALKNGIGILNSPGTIDSDYRGEVRVILFNFSRKSFVVNPGDRIAQLVFARVSRVRLVKSAKLADTRRGTGGFGHTGIGVEDSRNRGIKGSRP